MVASRLAERCTLGAADAIMALRKLSMTLRHCG
jgi:hypothetical protein